MPDVQATESGCQVIELLTPKEAAAIRERVNSQQKASKK